jgi:SWI/SNF-related matrix-associated actin-dependent regulator of chromatin subfamily B member 1
MGNTFGPGGMKIPGMGPGSPRIGGGLGLGGQGGPGNVASAGGLGLGGAGIMGPPGLPRTASGDAMNMNIMGNANPNAGININMINGQQRQSPRPQSSMGMTSDIASQLGLPPSGSTGPQQQQRQGSMPPQFANPQQQMRQGSLPPGPGQQQQRQKMGQDGMNMNIGGGGMGMSMGGAMGMGMKSNNDMRAGTSSTTPMNMGMAGMNPMGNMGGIGNMGGMNSGIMNSGMNNMGGINPMNMTMNIPPAPHSTSSNSSAPHTPASPLLGGGGPGPQGMVPSLSASSIGSNTGGQTTMPSTMPSIQQTPSMGPASISSTSASISGPTAIGDAPGTSSTPAIASTSTAPTVGAPSNTSSLPPLPPHVKPSTTQITTFPLATAHLHIPVLTSPEITQIQGWMKKDQEYEAILNKSTERMVEEFREALGTSSSSGRIGGTAAPGWWEMPGTGNFNRWRRRGEMFEVRYPRTKREREREREREGRGKKMIRREGLKLFVSFFSLCFVM